MARIIFRSIRLFYLHLYLHMARDFICRISSDFVDGELKERVQSLFESVGAKIEKGLFRGALEEIFETVRFGNAYYDAKKPWKTRADAPEECRNTISNCAYLIANPAILLHPFLPFSSLKVLEWLGVTTEWKAQSIGVKSIPMDISILFSIID